MERPDNVVCLDDFREQWTSLNARCICCQHRWVATIPVAADATKLECPNCGEQKSHCTMISLEEENRRLKDLFIASEDGCEFEAVMVLKEEVLRLNKLLYRISSMAGNPDPAEACRNIIACVKEESEHVATTVS